MYWPKITVNADIISADITSLTGNPAKTLKDVDATAATLALETGGNLATLAGIVASARAAVNPIASVAGITAGRGVVASGTPRVLQAGSSTWPDRAAVITSTANWTASGVAWTAGAYREALITVTGDKAYIWFGTADPSTGNGALLMPNNPVKLPIPADATDIRVKRHATANVTVDHILLD